MPVLLFVAFAIEAKTWHFWRPLDLEEFAQLLTRQIAADATHHWRLIKHHHCLRVGPPHCSYCVPRRQCWEAYNAIHTSQPWAVYSALAQIYTMQVWKAKERKVYTEQTQQLRLCHGVEEIRENHTKGERRVFNSFRPSFYQVILFLPIWMTHLSPTVHSNPGRKEEITSNNCVRVWKM